MFTGIVEEVGTIARVEKVRNETRVEGADAVARVEGADAVTRIEGADAVTRVERADAVTRVERSGGDLRVRIAASLVTEEMELGDSVAVSGCCLTVVEFDRNGFSAELSRETLAKTAPRWQQGARVNLERAIAAGGRFGGHMVSGHVEGVGLVTTVEREPGAFVLTVRAPERLAGYLVPKGSLTVDGVSLTVVDCGGPGGNAPDLAPWEFTLWLIPHTLEATTLGELEVGSRVNLEADLIAKYLERLQLMKEPQKELRHVP